MLLFWCYWVVFKFINYKYFIACRRSSLNYANGAKVYRCYCLFVRLIIGIVEVNRTFWFGWINRKKTWRVSASGEAGHLDILRTLRLLVLKSQLVRLKFLLFWPVLSIICMFLRAYLNSKLKLSIFFCRSSWTGYCQCCWFGTCREALGCSLQQTRQWDCWPLHVWYCLSLLYFVNCSSI
jgi:hypothetical protein